MSRQFRIFIGGALLALTSPLVTAHPADVSQLRVRTEHDRVEFRFSFNIAAIARVVTIDTNQDNKVTFAEITAAVPAMRDFLSSATLVSINDEESNIGEFTGHECLWPNPITSEITPQDAGQRFVDLTFSKPCPKGVDDVWLGFKVFERLGDLHVIQCIFKQTGEPDTPVEFSTQEPDYLYDTGWTSAAQEAKAKSQISPAPSHIITWIIAGALAILGAALIFCRASFRSKPELPPSA